MHTHMTIQEFSIRTGVSKSTLRFYETKNLVLPVKRGENGYRIYAQHQIAIVKLITTLRIADVPIQDIQQYILEHDETARQTMMHKWIGTIKKKRDLMDISLRFLESDSIREDIYLIEKSDEKIIWFNAQSPTGKFGEHFAQRAHALKQCNIQINSYYVNYLSGQDLINAQIGFGVANATQVNGLADVDCIEQMPACICLALPFKEPLTHIKAGYYKLMQYAIQHSWVPTRSILEWYRGEDYTQLDLLLPVIQVG
ncbi:MerR family transcriptional regulator [Lysinibacillus sp. NPDC097195]|uniref:MerR family transcriptional regulator n=1 Tax=Lysinibacillus sp. NPDC097195 TaxID=3364141 RepID=UPI0038160682